LEKAAEKRPAGKILNVRDLAEAEEEVRKINAHPVGVKIMALKAVHRLVKFENVDSKTANIVKQEMLSRGGEVAVSRNVANFRDQTTDIIIMGTLAQYVKLIRKLRVQPECCPQIADELKTLLFKDTDIEKCAVW
jgi:dihydropteroate synthase